MAQNIYDTREFFEGYSRFPRSLEGLEGAPEWPALRALLPPLEGLRVLDLGCGFGWFARWAHNAGAGSVVGVDVSKRMLERAHRSASGEVVRYLRADLERLPLACGRFDLVFSSLALHYLKDYEALCGYIRRLLTPGGHLVFSVEHPIFTAPSRPGWRTDADGYRFWPVDGYLKEGGRTTEGIVPGVEKYHRTVAGYVNPLLERGFRPERLVEWGPSIDQIAERVELEAETHRPAFLLIRARTEWQPAAL